MNTLAKNERKPLQIKEGTRQWRELWEQTNAYGKSAIKNERLALRDAMQAGAGLLILQGKSKDGDWTDTLAANSTIPLRTAQRWMQNVNNVLDIIGAEKCERSYNALIGDQDDEFSRALLESISNVIEGKTAAQLQLSFRAPKQKALPADLDAADPDPAVRAEAAQRRAGAYIDALESALAPLPAHAPHFTRDQLDRFNALLKTALTSVNPALRFE
jgi:hypothetical protein